MTDRVVEAIEQRHRADTGRMALQLAVYRQQLLDAGVEPDDRSDDELMRLWRSAAAVVNTASMFVMELGPAKELLDPNLLGRR